MARRTIALAGSRMPSWTAGASLVLLVTLNLPRAGAQPNVWTLQSAELTAIEHSPRMRSIMATRETAYAYRTFGTMSRAGNPFVALRAMIGKPDQSAATYAGSLGIPFDATHKRSAWKREASSLIDEAEARLIVTRNEVRAEARAAYVRVALAHAAHTVAEESAGTARELLERVQARLDAKSATALDYALSESQYAEATANLARADRSLVEAENAFRQTLGLRYDAAVEVTSLPGPRLPEGLTVEAAVQRARDRRKETVAWASVQRRWTSADGRLRAEAIKPITAQLESEAQANRNTQYTVGAGVGFELPVIQKNQGERAVARGEAAAAELERELAGSAIEREASSSFLALQAALVELAAIEERALPAAERTLTMVGVMLEAGVVDYFRVLTARSVAFALRSRRVEALREAWLCRIALERAIGGWEEAL